MVDHNKSYRTQFDQYSIVGIESYGDYWTNKEQSINMFLTADPTKPILLDMHFQGISLVESGAHSKIQELIKLTQRTAEEIYITNPNRLEDDLGYKNIYNFPICDEFLRMQGYWVEHCRSQRLDAKRFGHFIGRATTPRIKFFYDIKKQNIEEYFLLSKLSCASSVSPHLPESGDWKFQENYLDSLDSWFPTTEDGNQFDHWFSKEFDTKSFDGLAIWDQFDISKTSRLNLVNKSDCYYMDIVFESLTHGKTFAPTEKLIRSLITQKPFMVYAAANYLKHLKSLGFHTFGAFWNENYDDYEQKERYDMMFAEIKKLALLSNSEFAQLMKNAQETCQHNKKILMDLNLQHYGTYNNWIKPKKWRLG